MKLASALASFAVAFAAMTFQSAMAQFPDQMFGAGISTGSSYGSLDFSYAFSPAVQAGAGLGLRLKSESHNSNSTSSTDVVFAPFVRYILGGVGGNNLFRPFVSGQFLVSSNSASNSYPNYEGNGTTTTGLGLGGGILYHPVPPIQITGQINVGEWTFGDNSTCDYGLVGGRLGVAFFWECCWLNPQL